MQVGEFQERVCRQFDVLQGPSGTIKCKHTRDMYRCGHPDTAGQFCKLTRYRVGGCEGRLLTADQIARFSSSGLTSDTLAAAHVFGVSTADALEELLGMPWRPDEPAEAIVFPYFGVDSRLTGYQRVELRFVREGQSQHRSPKGKPSGLYFPPGQADKLRSPTEPLYLTVGEELALQLSQHGYTACAAASEWGFHDAAARKSGEDRSFKLHPDFAGIPLSGRHVAIVFGSALTDDAKHVLALETLVGMLLGVGAHPLIVSLPESTKGLADILAPSGGKEAFDRLLNEAAPGEPGERVKWAKTLPPKAFAQALLEVMAHLDVLAGHDAALAAIFDDRVKKEAKQKVYKACLFELKKRAVVAAVAQIDGSDDPAPSSGPPGTPAPAPVPTDPALKAEVEKFLANDNILERLLKDSAALGIVGEEKPRVVVYLVMQSRKLQRPLHLLAVGQSATGKTIVIKVLLLLVGRDQARIFSVLSAKALCYQSQPLDGKIIFLEEQDGGAGAEYTLRLLQSEGQLTIESTVKDEGTGKFVVQSNAVSGRCVTISCTTCVELDPQNQSRLIEVRFDETQPQTDRILRQQRADAARLARPDNSAILDFWREVDRQLQPCKVVVPFAEQIAFPSNRVRSRRDQTKLLALIEASALLHQAQRQRIGDVVVADIEDYRLACILAPTVLPGLFHELPPDERQLYEWGLKRGGTFTVRQAAQALGDASLDRARKLLARGTERGWCTRVNPKDQGVAALFNVVGGFNAHASGLLTPEEVHRRWTEQQAQAQATPEQQAEPAGGDHA